MKKLNVFLILTLFGFGIAAETAYSAQPLRQAPDLSARKTDLTQKVIGVTHNARLAFAPYAQVVPNDSYTFIGISHPSLATAHTTIGLVVEAMDMTMPGPIQAGSNLTVEMQRAVAFTINAGETHRVFIINEDHANINSNNPDINNDNTHLIFTKKDVNQFGNIRVTAVGTEPNHKTSGLKRDGTYRDKFVAGTEVGVQRFDNLNQLAMWGVVYKESNGAGFSLEFIGDMHDSTAAGTQSHRGDERGDYSGAELNQDHPHKALGIAAITTSAGVGRGLN